MLERAPSYVIDPLRGVLRVRFVLSNLYRLMGRGEGRPGILSRTVHATVQSLVPGLPKLAGG